MSSLTIRDISTPLRESLPVWPATHRPNFACPRPMQTVPAWT